MEHIAYTAPWKLTWFGFRFGIGRGCDEWHNKSVYACTPLGMFVWFWTVDRTGEEHVSGSFGPVGGSVEDTIYEGVIYDDCDLCQEFMEEDNWS